MKYLRPVAALSLIALAACSGNDVKTTLGLDRGAPDEFRVVSRPPLSVPPQFDLRPPASVDSGIVIGQPSMADQAQALMTGKNASASGVAVGKAIAAPASNKSANPAESAFLNNVGANQADPKIRDEIVQDQIVTQQPQVEDKSWYNFWSPSSQSKPDPLVSAGQESQRIKTNEDSGQPVTAGDTPTVKQKDSGLVGQIFGY